MTAPPTTPESFREAVDALLGRLARLRASSVTLECAAGDIRTNGAPASVIEVLNDLDRDLRLAVRETACVRDELRR